MRRLLFSLLLLATGFAAPARGSLALAQTPSSRVGADPFGNLDLATVHKRGASETGSSCNRPIDAQIGAITESPAPPERTWISLRTENPLPVLVRSGRGTTGPRGPPAD